MIALMTDPSIVAVSGVGLLLGFQHAFEPDHLAAVSTLATRTPRLGAAARLGLAWALGHTASVGIVALAIIVLNLRLPPAFAPAAESLVALLLVTLGAAVITRYARGRWHLHAHSHSEAPGPHLHLHSHAQGASHAHAHLAADTRRSLGFGLLHGLAGSAAVLLLLVAAADTRGRQLAYFLAFGGGTVLGMLLVTIAIASVVRLASRRSARWATALHLSAAAASVVAGVSLGWRVWVEW